MGTEYHFQGRPVHQGVLEGHAVGSIPAGPLSISFVYASATRHEVSEAGGGF